jgi:hypothetical protein
LRANYGSPTEVGNEGDKGDIDGGFDFGDDFGGDL